MSNKIKVIVPFYNASEFIERCAASLTSQKYEDFEIIFIDDASTDNCWDLLPHDNPKAKCIRNEVNVTALPNIHNAIMDHCDADDIVVLVDGDDWLKNKKVLSRINEIYEENDCWIMYGQAMWTDGRRGFASAYPESEFANLRTAPFRVSHIRSFRAGLYHKIAEQDPTFSCMKDKDGEFYRMTYDVAIMFPIMEMAGLEKTLYNDEVMYMYNRDNPISDDKVNQQLQWDIHKEISGKKKFNKIESYK